MKPITITLEIAGKKKRYKAKKEVDISIVLNSIGLEEVLKQPTDEVAKIRACSTYICSVFGHKFTEIDLERNIEYTEIIPLTHRVMEYVICVAELKASTIEPKGEVIPFARRKKS